MLGNLRHQEASAGPREQNELTQATENLTLATSGSRKPREDTNYSFLYSLQL